MGAFELVIVVVVGVVGAGGGPPLPLDSVMLEVYISVKEVAAVVHSSKFRQYALPIPMCKSCKSNA